MDAAPNASGSDSFDGEPRNPLSAQSGYTHELLTELSDDQVGEYCRYWVWRAEQFRAEGRGFDAWKSSNQLSTGYREAQRRGLDVDALSSRIEEDLATRPEDSG